MLSTYLEVKVLFLRFFRTRHFLLLLLFLALFPLTACNRKDDGISPAQTATKSTDALSQFMANIGNATFSIDLAPPEENPISPAQMLIQSASPALSMRMAVPKAAVAPNPNGSNLALSAVANASSYWPWPLYGFPFTPDHGNNGNMADCWAASFQSYYHWYRLDWTASQTIGRIYVSHAGTPVSPRGQTISSIRYYDQPTNSWLTIPGSTLIYGASKPMFVDFSFSPVQTTGIILYMNTGPENPHPNASVFISEIEVYGGVATGSLRIASPTTGDLFAFGENISFIGSQTGTVTDIEWLDNGTVFASGLSTSKNDLSAGVHAITIRGLRAGSPVSDSVSITVIKSIKITDVDTGQLPVEPFKMSSIRGIKKLQAIGCFDDSGNTEFGAVKVKWSLPDPDGKLDPAHTMKREILDLLGSNRGKIGVLVTQNSTDTEILDSDTATFVSFFSGNITLKAEFRVDRMPHSVAPRMLAIGLRQPTIDLFLQKVETPIVQNFIEAIASKAHELYEKEGLLVLNISEGNHAIINQKFQPEGNPVDWAFWSCEGYLQSTPSYLNPLGLDHLADQHYGLRSVVPRQSEWLLQENRENGRVLNVFVTAKVFVTESTTFPVAKSGLSISANHYWNRKTMQKTSNPSESGILLTSFLGKTNANDQRTLAHEIGHALLEEKNVHVPDSNNLMSTHAGGDLITSHQWCVILDYQNNKGNTSFIVWIPTNLTTHSERIRPPIGAKRRRSSYFSLLVGLCQIQRFGHLFPH